MGPGTDGGGGTDSAVMVNCANAVAAPVTPMLFTTGINFIEGFAFDGAGILWAGSPATSGQLWRVVPAGTASPIALPGLGAPYGMAPAGNGALYVTDSGGGGVVQLNADMTITPLGSGITGPNGVAHGPDGAVYVTDFSANSVIRVMGGATTTYVAGVNSANGIAFSADGATLYVNAYGSGVLFAYDVSTGTAGAGSMVATGLGGADGVALDQCGNFYVNDNFGGAVLRIGPTGAPVETLATGMSGSASVAFGEGPNWDPTDLFVTATGSGNIYRINVGIPGVPLVP